MAFESITDEKINELLLMPKRVVKPTSRAKLKDGNRARAESSFYEDLKESLEKIIPAELLHAEYIYEQSDSARDYPIDYYVEGKHAPLYVFGVPGRDKARLTTIVLERLLRSNPDFDSLIIFSDQSSMPSADLARLTNTGGEMIASLDAMDDFKRKVFRKIDLN